MAVSIGKQTLAGAAAVPGEWWKECVWFRCLLKSTKYICVFITGQIIILVLDS